MTSHVSSRELQRRLDTLRAERRAQVADPVTKLTAYVLADATVDADRLQNKLLVGAVNSAGEPMSGVFIDYRVIDENATGSTFVLDGNPIGSSFGVTEEGFALAEDFLLSGKTPGTFVVRATAPESADPEVVFADFRITVSSQVPTTLRVSRRGDTSMPIGEPMGVQAKVQLLDQGDKLITFGSIQIQLHDPNQTGTLFMYDGGVLEFLQQSVSRDDPEGTDLLGYLVAGANAEGKEFYLRVNRIGRDPTLDIPYTGVKPTAVPGGQKRKPESQIAERRAKAANPVAKLEAFVLVNATVDADRLQNKLLVQATDAAGGYMENVFIDYRVIDENGTGSAFLLDGNPIGSSIGVTEGSEGFALAVDYLLTGKKPGTFTVRATAPENADPATVFADFRITISSLVPTSLRIVRRGSPSAPIGDLVPPDVLIELLDQNGNPITFGSIQTQIYDPNDTGSLYWADGVVNYIQTSVQPGGTPLVGFLMPGEDNVGKEFYLRVNRIGREPHIDIPYTSVASV